MYWGSWPWWSPQPLAGQISTALTALMHGARGFSLYMAAERDRWIGAPVGEDGAQLGDFIEDEDAIDPMRVTGGH